MYQQQREARVVSLNPDRGSLTREALDRAKQALYMLPNKQLSGDEVIKELYPEMLGALQRGASLVLIRETLFQQGVAITDQKWNGLSQQLLADLRNQ